jgi:hypothetical protein
MMTYAKTASRWSRRTAPIAASARRKMDADCTVEKYMTRSVRTVTRQTTVLIREIRFQFFPRSGRKMFVIVSRFDFFSFRRETDRLHPVVAALRVAGLSMGAPTSEIGRVSRVSPVHTARRNCTRDEGGPFEVGNQVLISSHRKLLLSKAMVVSVAETAGRDPVRQG